MQKIDRSECIVYDNCPNGYLRDTLHKISKICDIPLQKPRPGKGVKTMNQLCDELIHTYGSIPGRTTKQSKAQGNYETTEQFGMTLEYAICKLNNIHCSIDKSRINQDLLRNDDFVTFVSHLLTYLPHVVKHVGAENKEVDFILADDKTLSVKTNLQRCRKVCPQTIGQTTKQKFLHRFRYLSNMDHIKTVQVPENAIKQLIFSRTAYIVAEYLQHTFACNYILWVYRTNTTFHGHVINRDILAPKSTQ